jgi:hypothetical protein
MSRGHGALGRCVSATGTCPPGSACRPTPDGRNWHTLIFQEGTRLWVIPDAGHLLTDERPELLAPLLEEIRRIASSAETGPFGPRIGTEGTARAFSIFQSWAYVSLLNVLGPLAPQTRAQQYRKTRAIRGT